ncbi:MAG: alpha/beta hydrolase [Acidimicrobiales bacterium]
MKILETTTDGGVEARRFDLTVGDETVPGMHWLPTETSGPHATVCIGHGGFQHKLYGNVPELAIQLVTNLRVGVVALDAPGHGDRIVDKEAARAARDDVRSGGGAARRRLDPEAVAAMEARVDSHVAEWQALLDDLQTDERWASGPIGWWGVSMGTTHGLPLVARDRRVTAAVFGLNALRPGNDAQAALAASITVPVLFLNQSDDELMTRDAALALWDALGSSEKTMHINPGGHVQVPRFERDSSEAFFRRHLIDAVEATP